MSALVSVLIGGFWILVHASGACILLIGSNSNSLMAFIDT